MKFYHYLKKNRSSQTKQWYIFFDTETYRKHVTDEFETQEFRIGYVQFVRKDKDWKVLDESVLYKKEDLFDFIIKHTSRSHPLNCYAHNLAFDFAVTGIGRQMKENGFTLKKFFYSDRTLVLKYIKDRTVVNFIDSFGLLPVPLAKLGKLLGLEKMSVDFENVDDDKLLEYCKRDVDILRLSIQNFVEFCRENSLGAQGITIGQQAFNAFRHRFMNNRILIHANRDVMKLERNSYFGGRTECFYIGRVNEEVYVLDVNSMYPFVMWIKEYPVRLKYYHNHNISKKLLYEYLQRYCVIADVKLETDKAYYPLRTADKVIYPVGQFETCLCTQSLWIALMSNHIREIKEVSVYEKSCIFKDYIEWFYSKRLEFKEYKNEVYEFLCKLFLNSLYGKFGQKRRETVYIGQTDPSRTYKMEVYDESGTKIGDEICICGDIFLCSEKEEDSFNAFTAIASHVTDYARCYLTGLVAIAGEGHCYYIDTDSLIVDREGFNRLIDHLSENELGKLKIEMIAQSLEIFGPKDYRVGNKTRMKGIKYDAKKLEENIYLQKQFPNFASIVDKGMIGSVQIDYIEKMLRREYDKGIVTESGWVKPFHLSST